MQVYATLDNAELVDALAKTNDALLSRAKYLYFAAHGRDLPARVEPLYKVKPVEATAYMKLKFHQEVMADCLARSGLAELPGRSLVVAHFVPQLFTVQGEGEGAAPAEAGFCARAVRLDFVRDCEPSSKRARTSAFVPERPPSRFDAN
jgi:hypothetical protein